MNASQKQLNDILQKYWGYSSFRPMQEEIIQAVLAKKDLLVLMPTGAGKSLCFQIPALMQKGVGLVISPLIALMQDQVAQLKARGIPAAVLHGGMSFRELDIALDRAVHGNLKFLYVAPERLSSPLFRTRLVHMQLALIAVDEAHCIAQWGHDFRPSYLSIAEIKHIAKDVPMLALTATATQKTEEEIVERLSLRTPLIFKKSFSRPNLALYVRKVEDKTLALVRLLQKVSGSAIIYTAKRRESQWISEYLNEKGFSTTYYHAGLSPQERVLRQQSWLEEKTKVIVATNAFGMGIDKPNVRLVAHTHFPQTLEAYYQEAGRAGRDGKKAYAVVLYEPEEPQLLRKKIEESYPDLKLLKAVYQKVANYHQVAVGSHAGVRYPFDIEDFVHTYGLSAPAVYRALQRLEEAGLLQYRERFFQPAALYITASAQQLYKFQVQNLRCDALIKGLNLLYAPHIFADFAPISLKRIAKHLAINEKEIEQLLVFMERHDLLIYRKAQNQASITFLTPRYAASHIPISASALEKRKKSMQQKAKAVVNYMTHPVRCREQILLDYLDQVSYQRCGLCDRCIHSPLPEKDPKKEQFYRNAISKLLASRPYSVPELVKAMGNDENIIPHLRTMIEQGEAHYTKDLHVVGRKSL